MDETQCIFAVLAGRPDAPDWDNVVSSMASLMLCNSKSINVDRPRGDFGAVYAGVSFGGGQKVYLSSLVPCKASANSLLVSYSICS